MTTQLFDVYLDVPAHRFGIYDAGEQPDGLAPFALGVSMEEAERLIDEEARACIARGEYCWNHNW